jgi:hypothetical protein
VSGLGDCRATQGAESRDNKPRCYGSRRPEPRDQQRSWNGSGGEQRHRQAGQNADLGLRHAQVAVNEWDQRRHGKDCQAHAGAREPQQRQHARLPGDEVFSEWRTRPDAVPLRC